jgi:two-component system phosphate regulon sensor histidine kinase PhoR
VTAVQFPLHPAPGVLIVLHDVTELRSLERMRREFVSNVSHELKTPLTSIQAYADTLLDGGLKDEENNRVFVERILEQSNRLQTLIRDMLRLARIESQSEAFLMRPCH